MITVYTTKTCAVCPLVKRYLEAKGIEYKSIDVTDDAETRDWLRSKTGYMTVPVTSNGTEFVVGWQPGQLAELVG